MWLREGEFRIRPGGNTYINVPTLIAFKGGPLFAVFRQEDGYLGIDFEVYDSQGKQVASIRKNNVYSGDTEAYTVEGSQDRTYLKEKSSGRILVDLKKRQDAAPSELDVSVRTYLPNGQLLDLGPHSSNLGGVRMTDNIFQGLPVGIAIE